MALYMVKYDLKRPLQDYPRLYASIKACGMALHAMNNMWFVISSEMSAYKIADRVRLSADANDKGFVSRLSRSEEHTPELQSQSKLVCRLLLEINRDARPTPP